MAGNERSWKELKLKKPTKNYFLLHKSHLLSILMLNQNLIFHSKKMQLGTIFFDFVLNFEIPS